MSSSRRSPSPRRGYRDERSHGRTRDEGSYDRPLDRRSDAYRQTRDRGFDRDARSGDGRQNRDRERDGPARQNERDARDRPSERDSRQREDNDRRAPARRSASPSRARRSRSRSRSQSPREDKAKPNFANSGLLAAETKTVQSADGTKTVLKYHEPPEARKPLVSWRLYVFKGQEQVDLLHLQRQSAYLVGRDKAVVDVYVEHPSCSKQHAVIQYRYIRQRDEFGETKGSIKPYIIDLESTNGTTVNGGPIPPAQYYELQVNDVIKFGDSLREYVLINEEAT